jgi:hypothetical protein
MFHSSVCRLEPAICVFVIFLDTAHLDDASSGRKEKKIGTDLVDLHDVGIFVTDGEEIDLVRQLGSIRGTFLDQRYVRAGRQGFDDTGANAV